MMEPEEAQRFIQERDNEQLADRALRLVELDELLEGDWDGPYSASLDASLIFEDVKATWVEGFFAATVLAAYAYCRLQMISYLHLASAPSLESDSNSLSDLAQLAKNERLINVEEHARFLGLEDLYGLYTRASNLTATGLALERHLEARRDVFGDVPQMADARDAVRIASSVAIRWHSDPSSGDT
jgi:hypothetical protein